MVANNTSLGQFNLVGIPPSPRGVPQIEVAFDIDANGIINVSAKDLGTGKEQKITITASTKLSKAEIEKMMGEAEQHAEEDRKRKDEVEVRNNADSLLYATEKTISEFGDKIAKEQKDKIEIAVKSLKDALAGSDIEKIKKESESLSKVVQEAGASIYQQQASQQKQQAEEPKEEKEGDKVVDAEYEVIDDEKKRKKE